MEDRTLERCAGEAPADMRWTAFAHGLEQPGPRPTLLRLDLDGGELRLRRRALVDPLRRLASELGVPIERGARGSQAAGLGEGCGGITGLGLIGPAGADQALLVAVDSGRPLVVDPEALALVGPLGRRREWRACQHSELPLPGFPVRLGPAASNPGWLLALDGPQTHEPADARRSWRRRLDPRPAPAPTRCCDLVRIQLGDDAPTLERWRLRVAGRDWIPGPSERPRLLGGGSRLALLAPGGSLSLIDLDALPLGQRALVDPRELALELDPRPLPASLLALIDLDDDALLARERGVGLVRFAIGERGLGERELLREGELDGVSPVRVAGALRCCFTHRATREGEGLELVDLGEPARRFPTGQAPSVASPHRRLAFADDDGSPWLLRAPEGALELWSGARLDAGPVARWRLDGALSLALAGPPPVAAARERFVHADELAELQPLHPELVAAWRRAFGS